ncbi:hypothetical protein ACHAP3_011178 [Botrytis cinerea]
MKLSHQLVAMLLLAATSMASAFNCSISTFESFLAANGTTGQVLSAVAYSDNSTFVPPTSSYQTPTGMPANCAVLLNITTEVNTYFSFILMLPTEWNNRFFGAAQGGQGINYIDVATGMRYGFAAVGTDTGHTGSDMSSSWTGNPESINDWAWRANHEMTVVGKMLTEKWYGSAPLYSYYAGCSTGGRQSLKELEMFPEDYDGVAAGCPAWWTTHNQLWNLKQTLYQSPANSSHTIPTSMFSVIGDEVLRQCDPQDGLTDSIISDPLGCNFNPLTLVCTANKTTSCLTSPQLDTLLSIYNDWVDVNQTYVFSHVLYGSEETWAGGNIGDGSESNSANQLWYMQNILGLANFTAADLSYETVQYADATNPGNSSANNFDLSPFYNRGGKLLHYHGLADGTVAPGASVYFHDHVTRTLAPMSIEVDDFYRFFLVPGLEHCTGTPSTMNAPWYFAGANQAATLSTSTHSTPGYSDARHDILLAVMAWVENGTAPDSIIGTMFNDDLTVAKQRPICAFPKQAKYSGTGDVDAPESWSCESLY